MSKLDASKLILDPQFVDKLTQIKRTPQQNTFGENKLGEVKVDTIGVVVPASGKTVFRLPEDMRVAELYEFFLKGTITATEQGKYSDQIVFRGDRYNVQTVFDYSNWGAGYCQGTCIRQVPA